MFAKFSFKKISRHVLPRLLVVFAFFVLFLSSIREAAFLVTRFDFGYGSLNDGTSIIFVSILFVVVVWLAYDALVNLADSLGYARGGEKGYVITGSGNIINVEKREGSEKESRDFLPKLSIEKYEQGNPLAALAQARTRIYSHISRLQNSSIINLFIGIIIAAFGIITIGSTFFEIEKYLDKEQSFNVTGFLVFALLPRLSISLIVQIFSFFFLMMYRSNIHEIRYFQNEITNIDFIASAQSYIKNETDTNKKIVINSLLKTERNRIFSKNQKVVSPANDEDVILKLASIDSRLESIGRRGAENKEDGR